MLSWLMEKICKVETDGGGIWPRPPKSGDFPGSSAQLWPPALTWQKIPLAANVKWKTQSQVSWFWDKLKIAQEKSKLFGVRVCALRNGVDWHLYWPKRHHTPAKLHVEKSVAVILSNFTIFYHLFSTCFPDFDHPPCPLPPPSSSSQGRPPAQRRQRILAPPGPNSLGTRGGRFTSGL